MRSRKSYKHRWPYLSKLPTQFRLNCFPINCYKKWAPFCNSLRCRYKRKCAYAACALREVLCLFIMKGQSAAHCCRGIVHCEKIYRWGSIVAGCNMRCVEGMLTQFRVTTLTAFNSSKKWCTIADVCIRIKVTQGGMSQTKQSRVLKSTCCAVYKEAIMFLINTKLNELHQTSIVISVHDLSRWHLSVGRLINVVQ